MRAWAAVVTGCCLAVGCGGAVAEETPLPPEVTQGDTVSRGEQTPTASEPATPGPGETGARKCHLEVGEAQRVKVILPPTSFPGRMADAPGSLVEFRGELFFTVNNSEDGSSALWRSDGTKAGTIMVRDFSQPSYASHVMALTPVGDKLFFLASAPGTGTELWVSDGTTDGTRLVEDITPGPDASSLSHLTGLGNRLVFLREPPFSPTPTEPIELWRSDGTAEGTELLRSLGENTSVNYQQLQLGNTLLLFTTHPSRGTELFRTDGTPEGTGVIRRLDAGQTFIFDVRAAGSLGLFTLLDDGGLTEVWRTDGTTAGTVRIKTFGPSVAARLLGVIGEYVYLTLVDIDIERMRLYRIRLDGTGGREFVATIPNPFAGMGSAFPYLELVSQVEDRIYFSIGIGSNGPAPRDTQLWVTDGTRAGTRLLRRPLSLSDEYGSPLLAVDKRLVFFASFDEDIGIEPWVTDGTVRGTRLLRDIAPDTLQFDSAYPMNFLRVGNRVFFSAYDETQANQLWSVPLLDTCLSVGGEPRTPPAP